MIIRTPPLLPFLSLFSTLRVRVETCSKTLACKSLIMLHTSMLIHCFMMTVSFIMMLHMHTLNIKQPSQLGLQNTLTTSLQKGKTSPGYDTKQYDGEAPIILKLWGMQSDSSLPLLLGSHWKCPIYGSLWKGPIYGSDKTVWHLKWVQKMTYAKLNC